MWRASVLTLLLARLCHTFSFDFVVGGSKQLDFYYENGSLTHTEHISTADTIRSVTYDPVHHRVLFVDDHFSTSFIYSFDLTTGKIDYLFTIETVDVVRVVYEPGTQALYYKNIYDIYSLSLNDASCDKTNIVSLDHFCNDLAVDSCGGYIYWVTDWEIGRARLDGSERQVVIQSRVSVRWSLAIDQPTHTLYWTENKLLYNDVSIESANFNGENRHTLYIIRNTPTALSFSISKNYIYWLNCEADAIYQLPKNSSQTVAPKLYLMSKANCLPCHRVATSYTIQELVQGTKSCDALQELVPKVCRNYCFHGECSVSAEGYATCSCKAGYSGERCEVNACLDYCLHGGVCSLDEHHQRVCQCAAGYEGERCDVSICNEYCLRGDCSVGADGRPLCSCTTGYSGERCEVSICENYCLQGNCSVGADGQPLCSCTTGYSGERCEVSICENYCLQGNCSVGADGQPLCSCETGYSGVRCEVNTCCHEYCLGGGFCVLNEEDTPLAYQDRAGSDDGRCEVPANKDHSSDEGTASACRQFCLNDGVCSLSEAGAPVCRCTAHYAGERCDVPAFLAQWVYTHVPPPATLSDVKSTSASAVVSTTELEVHSVVLHEPGSPSRRLTGNAIQTLNLTLPRSTQSTHLQQFPEVVTITSGTLQSEAEPITSPTDLLQTDQIIQPSTEQFPVVEPSTSSFAQFEVETESRALSNFNEYRLPFEFQQDMEYYQQNDVSVVMAAKYFVWGEGVWREVDVASGRVSGWRRRARFVFLRRGLLQLARRRPVLRALDALARGQPSAAADGRRLAHRRVKVESGAPPPPAPPPPPAAPPPPPCAHHHCCAHNGGPARREAATQSARDAATCTEPYTLSVKCEPPARAAAADDCVSTRADHVSVLLGKQPTPPPAPTTDKKRPAPRATRARAAALSDGTDSTSADEPLQHIARRRSSYRRAPAVCKELIVSEADILALRGFVARTRPSALYRFDADDEYKRALFYAINPLVELERCARLERVLASRSDAALPHFAARLGLAPCAAPAPPRRRRERSVSSDTDKENNEKHLNKERSSPLGARKPAPRAAGRRRGDRGEKVAVMKAPLTNGVASHAPKAKPPAAAHGKTAARESEDSGVAPSGSDAPRPPAHVISKRASRANVKEYSNLEDHAIVAWVSSGARASQVGGNRVWRELQEQYERLTGRARSWHSLRNRYLRYILPALGALHLPPADVSRLRAAAATGAIKRQNRPSGPLAARRASIYKSPPRGAASRLPRARSRSEDDTDGPPSPKRRSLRVRPLDSSGKESPSKASSNKESPSKASTSNKDSSSKESAGKQPALKEVEAKEFAGKAGKARSPRYSEVTRRFAARHRRLPSSSASRSPSPPRSPSPLLEPNTRSRRLFNPNANL
ncbi:hypothetical protein PYW08_012464 [Mythimna loreyi]|uniref:Uncharacterized protein n=1 Tax=Mythimna loreyi TaxID=667449 RepID=A0ACC2Q0S1_9NEOP|nr:hypothetical protein PYW08_012464 [Mythimna loreyi]